MKNNTSDAREDNLDRYHYIAGASGGIDSGSIRSKSEDGAVDPRCALSTEWANVHQFRCSLSGELGGDAIASALYGIFRPRVGLLHGVTQVYRRSQHINMCFVKGGITYKYIRKAMGFWFGFWHTFSFEVSVSTHFTFRKRCWTPRIMLQTDHVTSWLQCESNKHWLQKAYSVLGCLQWSPRRPRKQRAIDFARVTLKLETIVVQLGASLCFVSRRQKRVQTCGATKLNLV